MPFHRALIISTVQREFAVVSKLHASAVSTPLEIKFGGDHDEHSSTVYYPLSLHCSMLARHLALILFVCYNIGLMFTECYEIHKHNVNNLTSQCYI